MSYSLNLWDGDGGLNEPDGITLFVKTLLTRLLEIHEKGIVHGGPYAILRHLFYFAR
jgi:hypothetical protein